MRQLFSMRQRASMRLLLSVGPAAVCETAAPPYAKQLLPEVYVAFLSQTVSLCEIAATSDTDDFEGHLFSVGSLAH